MDHSKQPRQNDLPLDKLASPARRALENAGFTCLTDLTLITESELAQLHGIGPNAMKVIKKALSLQSLAFCKD